MNNEERELINKFFDRVGGNASSQSGSVPMTNQMPPVDLEADRLIKDNLQKYPEAGYRMTQMAVVQEAALAEAQNRIRQLEWQLQQTSQQLQQVQQQAQNQQPASSGGFLGGLFGGNRQQNQASSQNQVPPPGWGAPNTQSQLQGQQGGPQGQLGGRPYPGQQGAYSAPPPQNYPPGYQQGMFNRGGGGFLGSALTTAAGVAGGMFAYNALSGLFSGGHGGATGAAVDPTAGAGVADPFAGGADPFAGTGAGVDPGFDAGAGTDPNGWGNDAGWGADTGTDNSGWGDNTTTDDSGWGDGGSDDGSWGDDSF